MTLKPRPSITLKKQKLRKILKEEEEKAEKGRRGGEYRIWAVRVVTKLQDTAEIGTVSSGGDPV